ncbi:protein SCO2 homolog, mitochondrial-like isoform X2 [Dreissena polymorpha]|nr:protein SCO2 homolog, mitochondrial-like isoform X2 [Dreissena polymorpha]
MSTAEQQQAAIGGDWELVNTDGKTVTNKDYEGHWCIVYFGFTHCPDICPDEIEKIVEVTNILERDNSLPKIVPIFVTIDPDRDTPAIIKDYLADFGPNLVGLSGSWEQLRVILKEFKVYYSKGPVDEDGDYIVDHSIITFLMNPEGKMAAYFPRSKTNIEIATHIRKLMKSYKQIYKTS